MGDKDLIAQQEARDAVDAARMAFEIVSEFDQHKIDSICDAMSRVALTVAVLETPRINGKRTDLRPKMFGITSVT